MVLLLPGNMDFPLQWVLKTHPSSSKKDRGFELMAPMGILRFLNEIIFKLMLKGFLLPGGTFNLVSAGMFCLI